MNIDQIKKEFPIFDEKIQNNDLVYLDSANSSQKPKIVVDRINEFYTKQFSNVGRSVHYLAAISLYFSKNLNPTYFPDCEIELSFNSLNEAPIDNPSSINKTLLDLNQKSFINVNFIKR